MSQPEFPRCIWLPVGGNQNAHLVGAWIEPMTHCFGHLAPMLKTLFSLCRCWGQLNKLTFGQSWSSCMTNMKNMTMLSSQWWTTQQMPGRKASSKTSSLRYCPICCKEWPSCWFLCAQVEEIYFSRAHRINDNSVLILIFLLDLVASVPAVGDGVAACETCGYLDSAMSDA